MKPKLSHSWWDLHLRFSRGESLTEAEQQQSESELARHNQNNPLTPDQDSLRNLCKTAMDLDRENARLWEQVNKLEREI